MQELSFCMKGAWHKIGQVIFFHSKNCHGYFVSFLVTHSFRAKNVPICTGEGGPLCLQGLQHLYPSKSSLPWLRCGSCAVWQPSRQDAFTAKYAHSPLKHSPVPTSWLLCNAQNIFPTGARAQQQYHSNRGNFECLVHLLSLAIKAFNSPYRAQLTHDCNAGLLWTLSPQVPHFRNDSQHKCDSWEYQLCFPQMPPLQIQSGVLQWIWLFPFCAAERVAQIL